MKSIIDTFFSKYLSNNILFELLFLSLIQLFIVLVFKESIGNAIYVIFALDLYKLYKVISEERRLTSPIFFITVVFVFWLSLGNFINVLKTKYTDDTHYFFITLLVIISFIAFLLGLMIANKIKIKKMERLIPYIKEGHAFQLLYLLVFISFIGAFFYNLPIIKAFIRGAYFGNRINMMFGRGYLGALGSLHGYVIPFILMVKLSKNRKVSVYFYLIALISLTLTIIPLNRGPILTFFLTYIFIYNDFKKMIPIKKLIKYGTYAILGFGIILPVIRGHTRSYIDILSNEVGIHTWNLSHYIGMTEHTGFFGLKPITMALSIILPGHQDDFVVWIKAFSGINVQIGGASLSLIGEGFLEGGIVGVVLNFLILGLLASFLYKQRLFSYGAYFFYIYFLNRTESIIQFGYAKVLLTMIIVSFVLFFINLFKTNEEAISTA